MKNVTTMTVLAAVFATQMSFANDAPLIDESVNFAFANSTSLNVHALGEQEMKETEGAWFNFAIGGLTGFGSYAAMNYAMNKPITWQGSLYSIGTGALTGGVGSLLGKAAGGGIGNVIWKGNAMVLNGGLGTYRSYRGW